MSAPSSHNASFSSMTTATPSTVIEAATKRLNLNDSNDSNERLSGVSADGMSGISDGETSPGNAPNTNQPFQNAFTKVYYYIDDENIAYLTEVHVPPDIITLADVKRVLMRTNFKYYCKMVDPDTGIEVKAEIRDDMQRLHKNTQGKFELFLLTTEGSTHSDGTNSGGIGRSRNFVPGPAPGPMYHMGSNAYRHAAHQFDNSLLTTDSESMISGGFGNYKSHLNRHHLRPGYFQGHRGRGRYEDSTMGSESDARMFSDEDDRGSTTTDLTSVSRQHENLTRRRRNRRHYRKPSRASSFSSITESSMSLDVITVTLNMDTVNFLGISIVGQTGLRGDSGIYVASIMKGGAVALDGRIEAGDMILQVNDIAFDNFTNDQAVDVLRDAVARRGPIKLTVAKCFDAGPRDGFAIPRHQRDEPVRPIDTQAWIQHTNAMRGMPSIIEGSEGAPTPIPHDWPAHQRPASSSTVTSTGSNGHNTVIGSNIRLDLRTDKKEVVKVMATPNSGLDIKDRTWLKIPIPMSFLGSDLVDWLLDHVDGLRERKDARKYASELLRLKLIVHVVSKITFTEQCYYVLGDAVQEATRYRSNDALSQQPPVRYTPQTHWSAGNNQQVGLMSAGLAPSLGSLAPKGRALGASSLVSDSIAGVPPPNTPLPQSGQQQAPSNASSSNAPNAQAPMYVSDYASLPHTPVPPSLHSNVQRVDLGGAPQAVPGRSHSDGGSSGTGKSASSGRDRDSAHMQPECAPSRQSFRQAMMQPYECYVDKI
ncbi:hypothetical protein WR25_02331 [Diploscapter pachys]|uniref:DEP domain-containing protein n=1 Tax=Diploscapter pachys TaxID=2018661 RepID=A0A2A2K0X0_9BILA|nr:hypothetical protein WR25_02331 [Diploscapter pachys]